MCAEGEPEAYLGGDDGGCALRVSLRHTSAATTADVR